MNILYYDNCWFTNVGEAFIDIGAMNVVKKLFPEAKIANISNMSKYYVPTVIKKGLIKKEVKQPAYDLLETTEYFDFDVLILAGMYMSKTHLRGGVCKFVRKVATQGKQIIFLGLGEENGISGEDVMLFRKYLDSLNPILVATRDKKTYNHLFSGGQIRFPLILGIDMAFWCKDSYDPRGFAKDEYDVVAFNRSTEPKEFFTWKRKVIRPYHMQWSAVEKVFEKPTFISDIPYDYMTIYANANHVYTDLVHATIISLQYGRWVNYFYTDNRSDAFLDMSCLRVKDNQYYMIEDELEECKQEVIKKIQAILKDEKDDN